MAKTTPKTAPKTLYDKIFDDHVVSRQADGTCILYVDRHLVHEVTSPQAFEGLRMAKRQVRAPEKTLAVVDHNIATSPDRHQGIKDEESRIQVETMARNAKDFGIEYYDERDVRQGIVHVIGPEQGFTLPGTTIVCGDSHTSTHGAFGALAHGHRHQRGGACAGDANLDAEEGQEHARHRRRQAARRRDGQGHHPLHHRRDRHRRRHRPCHRVLRRGHPRPLHGGPHDRVQHVDRGRRAGRHGGAGRRRPSPISRAGRNRPRVPPGSRR